MAPKNRQKPFKMAPENQVKPFKMASKNRQKRLKWHRKMNHSRLFCSLTHFLAHFRLIIDWLKFIGMIFIPLLFLIKWRIPKCFICAFNLFITKTSLSYSQTMAQRAFSIAFAYNSVFLSSEANLLVRKQIFYFGFHTFV